MDIVYLVISVISSWVSLKPFFLGVGTPQLDFGFDCGQCRVLQIEFVLQRQKQPSSLYLWDENCVLFYQAQINASLMVMYVLSMAFFVEYWKIGQETMASGASFLICWRLLNINSKFPLRDLNLPLTIATITNDNYKPRPCLRSMK